jgi:hypothetical protein
MIGPPVYLVSADKKTVTFAAPDKSWRLTMTRQKWSEQKRPEVLYAVNPEVNNAA